MKLDNDKLRQHVEDNCVSLWPASGYERYEMFKTYVNNLSNVELLELIEQSGCIVDDSQAPTG